MSSIGIIMPVVTSTNSCYNDYIKFRQMPQFELKSMQTKYYAELHALQDELTELLDELREWTHMRSRTLFQHSA
ncbi:hypothetical protein [Paenibacillus rigui]|uniref:Uncharacterized protein n=1 Tax=Paenibacillus rigui TaxID=554312 RepID=A0A229UX51_9BACL|nr:hypothetical protein [Paenibacillus rigui]OXM87998.1 hypothetical protein CF651_02570 [Paenibacillus rigui]